MKILNKCVNVVWNVIEVALKVVLTGGMVCGQMWYLFSDLLMRVLNGQRADTAFTAVYRNCEMFCGHLIKFWKK